MIIGLPTSVALYTPYRHGSHCWAFDCAIGRVDSLDSLQQAQRVAKIQKQQDEAECRDPKKIVRLTWAMRRTLDIYPDGMSEHDSPYRNQPSETAVM